MNDHDHDWRLEEAQDNAPTCKECNGRGYLPVEADGGGPGYACPDCGEVRYDEDGEPSARVQAGMKCGVCAYGY